MQSLLCHREALRAVITHKPGLFAPVIPKLWDLVITWGLVKTPPEDWFSRLGVEPPDLDV